tara:strand:- start:16 stop:354 length:339 start_codon:yes stop_codon:yes gene_type:complete
MEVFMIYEYRVYEAMPGKLEELNRRFRDHTLGLFEKHGIKNVGYWTGSVGEYSDRLIYIIAFEDMQHRERAWMAFRKDPEWISVRASSESQGPLVSRVYNSILNPTDYSPLQ